MNNQLSLAALKKGQSALVTGISADGDEAMGRRLLDIGLIRGTRVSCVGVSPAGDPCAYFIRGAVIALRAADARRVGLERVLAPVPDACAVPV